LVLAAGSSVRFGSDKLMAPFRGRPLVAHTVVAVTEAITAGTLAGGVAVIPSDAAVLAWQLDQAGLLLVENPEAATGLASSLKRGLAVLAEAHVPPAGAAVVILADQPGLRAEVIARLVERWRRSGLSARPRYREMPDEPGHPVLLDRSVWPLAATLTGDTGLGSVLRGDAITLVDVAGANPDVDTPADLRDLEELS